MIWLKSSVAVLLMAVFCAGAGAAPVPTCGAAPHTIVDKAVGSLVVYSVRGSRSDAEYACIRGSKVRVLIGHDDSYQATRHGSAATTTVTGIAVAGVWLTAVEQIDPASYSACLRYGEPSCAGPDEALEVANAAAGSVTTVAGIIGSQGADTQTVWEQDVLSSTGAIGWITHTTAGSSTTRSLSGCLAVLSGAQLTCPVQQLALNGVGAQSLSVAAQTLTWTQDGAPRSATLS